MTKRNKDLPTAKEMDAYLEELRKECWIEGDYLYVSQSPDDDSESAYDIKINRINTPEKLIVWILHLSEKTWVTPQKIHMICLRVKSHFGWDLPYGC